VAENRTKILCVDDEKSILESLERTLRGRYAVLTSLDPVEALSILEEQDDIAVVISDHMMSPMDGVQFLSRAKKIRPHTSRVLLSGEIDIRSMETAINNANVHKFVMKPWDNQPLLVHLLEAVRHHQTLLEKDRLKMLSITDPITQLTNHRFFQENLRMEWTKHQKNNDELSVVFIDIDHFKRFNDKFGHPEGDKVLTKVATRLKSELPPGASLSRYGGEEFALVLSDTDSAGALKVAENLRQAIAQETFEHYPLSISLGIATSPRHASSVNELIISADQSLYHAKRRGRNQTIVGIPIED